jgi:protein involved in polysaccharide export with SLBB domain
VSKRILVSSFWAALSGVLVVLSASAAIAQQLPIDPEQISQLTTEQKQKLLENMGQSQPLGNPGQAQDEGRPRSGSSVQPQAALAQTTANNRRPSLGEDHGSVTSVQEIKPFGYDLFSTVATTFAPATDIPVPADYVLGPGDTLQVQLFGNTIGNYRLVISRDGSINFPKLGPISVVGQRFDDARSMLQERVAREMIGVEASITLGELRSIRVFLLGDVNQPGSYTVSSLSTVTNALLVGGGVSFVGSLRNIQLKRSGQTVRTLDLYDFLLHGDSSHDERLQPGDVIFVPPVGARVSVDGEVKRPAIYELKGERSVNEVLNLAGGLMASTSTTAVQIKRYDQNRKQTQFQIDASKASDLASRVQDGDFISVRKISGPVDNGVQVIGFVRYSGTYEWSATTGLADLLHSAQVLPSDAEKEVYLPLGLIERTNTDSGVRYWISFNVRDVLAGNTSVPLQRNDLVVILRRDDIAYLDSAPVHAVVQRNFNDDNQCPGLKELAAVVASERSTRFLKQFVSESAGGSYAQEEFRKSPQDKSESQSQADGGTQLVSLQIAKPSATEDVSCPDVFIKAPRALPYLLDQAVVVYGEIRFPGLYPIAPNTPLNLLVETAGGRNTESDPTNIEYVSYEEALKSGRSRYQTLDFGKAANQSINPGDILNFKPLYLGQEVGSVRVYGEFRFPATYGILRGEKLSELTKRAGGLTDDAFPYGAVFTRISARKAEQESYSRAASDLQQALVTAVTSGAMGKDAQISTQFLNTVIQQIHSAIPVGRVVIQTDPAVLAKHPELDPVLEPGDAIFMPKHPISITITGQVLNPGTLAYMPNISVKQYINRAGGYTQAADSKRIFVIFPNGSAEKVTNSFWSPGSMSVPPGSIIVVPRDATPFNLLGYSDRIFGILANMAVSVAALATISKL